MHGGRESQSMDAQQVVLRPCEGLEELQACVSLQKQVWGWSDAELVPRDIFVVAMKIGGQVIGSFDRGMLVGYVLSFPGFRRGDIYLHSHMLAIREDYRNLGLGRRLKCAQREEALRRGFTLIEWTFDPLETKNAHFNLERLGAIVRRYVRNQYGITSSHLHAGLPTDRCMAEWWLNSCSVKAVLNGRQSPRPPVELRISVPEEIAELRRNEPKRAVEIQTRIAEELTAGFDKGLAVIGFDRSGGTGTYLLGKWESK